MERRVCPAINQYRPSSKTGAEAGKRESARKERGLATYAKSHNANSSSIDSRRQQVGTALAACTTVHIVVGSGMRFFLRRNPDDLRASELVQSHCFPCYSPFMDAMAPAK
jgi:hypothetical protein